MKTYRSKIIFGSQETQVDVKYLISNNNNGFEVKSKVSQKDNLSQWYYPYVEFAVKYLRLNIVELRDKHYSLDIYEIYGVPTDFHLFSVFFATIKIIEKELNLEIEKFGFSDNNQVLNLPFRCG